MRFTSVALFASLTVLTACASQPAPTPVVKAPAKTASVSDLELVTANLREQHEAMSETLTWLDGEVTALRAAEKLAPAKVLSPETVAPSSKDDTEAPETADDTPPTKAEVGELTEQDMAATETKAATPEATKQVPMIHLASYLHADQADAGWATLQNRYPAQLAGLKVATMAYTDKNGQVWERLLAGPFATKADASARCDEIKTAGGWCEVLNGPAN